MVPDRYTLEGETLRTGRSGEVGDLGHGVLPARARIRGGVELLKAGGSAVDAAIAASAVIVYPHMTAVGGDAFWLISTGHPRVLPAGAPDRGPALQ